jgi:hypothetical protein
MKYLYKYPQLAYPYDDLVRINRNRSRQDLEYELLNTGIFDHDRYFDVFVEYAKAAAEDILIQITVCNRGPEAATLQLLPTLWFRNVWSWGGHFPRPVLRQAIADSGGGVTASDPVLGERFLYCEGKPALLFTENETNTQRLVGVPNRTPYVKDGINDYIVHGRHGAVNPQKTGTKMSAHYALTVGAGESELVRLRLSDIAPVAWTSQNGQSAPFAAFNQYLQTRRQEADEFYAAVIPSSLTTDQANVMRQALAGMLWSKQFYYYDVDKWLEEHDADPFKPRRRAPPK